MYNRVSTKNSTIRAEVLLNLELEVVEELNKFVHFQAGLKLLV